MVWKLLSQVSSAILIIHIGVVYNIFESVDVIALIRGGVYDDLSLTVGEVLKKRSPVWNRADPPQCAVG